MIAYPADLATLTDDTPKTRTVLLNLPVAGVRITDQDQLEPYVATPLAHGERIAGLVMTPLGVAVTVTVADGEVVSA
ncbi:hypothetical protein [Gordonia sp. YY1]|uniref:hypothetical protein n=1 Tax=Gordonia sp. YY1 TaxID=396712 RepID=UPI001331431F|nr:hypothetical protein [Gordonia sp. YY1]KAF0967255.1 hypothetical protein BPODLACK_04225 [Gordonia sp. YY1]